eukprot:2369723-Pleurochrysis_carterae.AAC.3
MSASLAAHSICHRLACLPLLLIHVKSKSMHSELALLTLDGILMIQMFLLRPDRESVACHLPSSADDVNY